MVKNMSYEGTVQRLCKNGHLEEVNCYNDSSKDRCEYCNELFVYRHGIDQTNGYDSRDKMEFEILTSAEYDICPTCNHIKLIKPATYKIPEKDIKYEEIDPNDNEYLGLIG